MAKSTLTVGTCKACKTTDYAPTGLIPNSFALREKKAPLGLRIQDAGSRMSLFSGGASKGGYAAQAAHGARSAPVCNVCGSTKVTITTIKVSVERAKQLLSGMD